ncbi:MAG TPA: GNAT family N-acetyltransferase [Pyrinomonadaceae bacterium]|nr:GNAT family N-acetyltransferase [Pyrinomonadaceae bacterium]
MDCILAINFIAAGEQSVDRPTIVLQINEVNSSKQLRTARHLLEEYWTSLGFDRETFGFGEELDSLPGAYARPEGRLALAVLSDQAVGCIALRRLDNDSCEMKRLFVRQSARGKGIALALLTWLVAEARSQGYSRMLADTLPTMNDALRLYERFGFTPVESYSPKPTPGAIYLQMKLR